MLQHNEAMNRALFDSAPIATSSKSASYADMRLDSTIAACLETIVSAVLADPPSVVPQDSNDAAQIAVALDIENNLKDIPLETILEIALDTTLWRGFAPAEVTWKYSTMGKRFWIESVADLDTEQISLDLDDKMNVLAYKSEPTGQPPKTVHPPKLWFNRLKHSRQFPAGRSILDHIHRPWNAKDNYLRFWGLTLQRYGMPLFILELPSTADSNTEAAAIDAAYQLRLDGIAVFPSGVGYKIEQPPQWHGLDFETSCSFQDAQIIRGLLLTLGSSGGSGQTYVTGEGLQQQARGTSYLLARLSRKLCASFRESVIRPIVYANYGERPDLVPHITLPPPGETNLPDIAPALTQLVTAGVITPEQAATTAGYEFDAEAMEIAAQKEADAQKGQNA